MDLIHDLEKASTKDDLEALGIEHLGIDVDKRKAKEVLRAELIGEAEAQGFTAEAAEPEQNKPTAEAPKADTYPGKLGRNKRTGVIMPWSSAMAKMPHMEEV